MFKLFKQINKPKKNNIILLSVINLLKIAGQMGIPLRGHRDNSQYHPEVGEPTTHVGVGNFAEFLKFVVRQGNKNLEGYLKSSSSRETYIFKTTQNNLLNCCYDLMTEAIIKKLNRLIFFSFVMKFRFIEQGAAYFLSEIYWLKWWYMWRFS